MRDERSAFTDHLREQTNDVREHEALDEVRGFLRGVTQPAQRSSSGRLRPHFYANGRGSARTVADFIADTTRGAVNGWSLEVISPYVDDADVSKPLAELVRRFGPGEVLVLVPEDNGGARCRRALDDVVEARGWKWRNGRRHEIRIDPRDDGYLLEAIVAALATRTGSAIRP